MSMASAPGKVILFGEHSVVYGKPALVGALSARVHASVAKADSSSLSIPELGLSGSMGKKTIHRFFASGIKDLGIGDVKIEITSGFPIGAGLGSSSAMACAFLQAASDEFSLSLGREQIRQKAHAMETVIHGNPSGIDTAISTSGGFIRYEGGKITPLQLPDLPLIIGYTNKSGDTGKTVAHVRELYESDRASAQATLDKMGEIAEKAANEKDLGKLGELMNQNHALLQELGVSSPELDKLVQAARAAGAYGAKLTGGGGGGCMIALGSRNVADAISGAGGTPIDVKLSRRGVESETIS